MKQPKFLILFLCAFIVACSESEPEATNTVISFGIDPASLPAEQQATYNGQGIELTNAWEVIDENEKNHSKSEIHISDGNLQIKRFFFVGMEENAVFSWAMTEANIWINALVYSSDMQALDNGVYTYLESDRDLMSGSNYFAFADVHVDFNQDQEFNSSERMDVVDGTLTINGSSPNYTMTFDLQLENGASVNATYTGSFVTRSQLPSLPFLNGNMSTTSEGILY